MQTLDKTLHVDLMKGYREIIGKALMIVDSGIFTFFSKFGVGTTVHTIANEYAISQGMSKLQSIKEYTNNYAQFLKDTAQYWDIAVDFDADSFLDESIVDEIHEEMVDIVGVDRSRFMRVLHYERPNWQAWWENICKDPRYTCLGIGSGNRRDWDVYAYMIDIAHGYGKLVHAFGLGSREFLRLTPVDTADTTSHLVGGKFGTVFTPIGNVSFPKKGSKKSNVTRYFDLTQENQQWLRDLWSDKYDISVEQLQDCPYPRNLVNIWHMNEHWDVPYIERSDSIISLFDII